MKKLVVMLCAVLGAQMAFSADFSVNVERALFNKIPQEKLQGPRVACEIKVGDKWQLSPEEECAKYPQSRQEVTYLKQILADLAQDEDVIFNTKALGPVNLSKEMLSQTFLVNHYWTSITKRYMGFGPEDDPQFDYTRPGYYPQGSVKVNLTERAYDVVRLYFEKIIPIYGKNSKQARGLRGLIGMVFFHEVMHGWQLHTKSVLDFKRLPLQEVVEMLESRTPREEVVQGTNQIVQYEEDANVFTYNYTAKVYPEFMQFKQAFEELSKQEGFYEQFPLLGETFYTYYIINEMKGAQEVLDLLAQGKEINTFNELNGYTYHTQNASLQAWSDMVHINDALAAGKTTCQAVEEKVRAQYAYTMDLSVPEFNGRNENNQHDKEVMEVIRSIGESYSGLQEIRAAAIDEFNRFAKQCNIAF